MVKSKMKELVGHNHWLIEIIFLLSFRLGTSSLFTHVHYLSNIRAVA
jgi:hypothetical protein